MRAIWADKLMLTILWTLFGIGFFCQVILDSGEGLQLFLPQFIEWTGYNLVPIWLVLRGIDLIFTGDPLRRHRTKRGSAIR